MKSIWKTIMSWSPNAYYMFSDNAFRLTIPFISNYDIVKFIKAEYKDNTIIITGNMTNKGVIKSIKDNITYK